MVFNRVTVDDFLFEMADEISINPPEDVTPDSGAEGEGGMPDSEKPAGDGGQRINQQPDSKTFTQAELDHIIGDRLTRERDKHRWGQA